MLKDIFEPTNFLALIIKHKVHLIINMRIIHLIKNVNIRIEVYNLTSYFISIKVNSSADLLVEAYFQHFDYYLSINE